ncbi:ABC transporter ATP-binding protein [Niameybacter massiliensis]|uniref:ABC transporter ATP-binding protein n=1 Tax=Holtiella tumoricola TaxID=3018743 RepID=A0AA42DJN4_9FIRM|nr:ABC transporter ATP-binding protein [Holtiella tumoricola]MDA3730266.1 ABC transporter ATP-binding protein [Holtiella tumoricola]
MLKMIKYLKRSALSILVIVVLLMVQAICDLSLPDYTSNIVNVGIQQGGVENAIPKVIRKTELDKLTLFMSDEEQELVKANYILVDGSEVNEYPLAATEQVYKLNTKDKEVKEQLNNIFGRAILPLSALSKMDELPSGITIPEGTDVTQMIAQMPKEQLVAMQEKINEQFANMPESMITQSATQVVKAEYEAIGLNMEKMQSNYILYSGGLMLLIALISMAATVTVGFLGARVAAGLGRDLRGKVFNKVVSFSNAEIDQFSTASLITRSTNDIQQIQMLMVMLLRVVFYAPILGLGGVIKVLGTNTSMAWIIAVAVMAILTLVLVLFAIAIPKFKMVQKLVDKVNLVMREILTGMLVIRAFSTQKHEEERFDKANKDLMKTTLFVNRSMATMMPIMMLIMNCITVLIVWKGAHSVDAGTMQVGDMMAFIQYTMQIIMSFFMISMVSIMLPRASVSALRIEEVLQTEVTIKNPKATKAFNQAQKGIIEFKNVSFRYPNAEENVLMDINFVAKPGQTTAFIGSTGSGKSTLINLIPRFYDATQGEILVNGVNIKDVSQHDLREKIGYVPQKGVLFSGTIDSNLRYGTQDATQDQIEKAAKIAQASDFIAAKPEGFDSEIAQGGTNVSGGQKQRLSIARAIAKDPEIYIFDDSFSALDYKTDVVLRKALKQETVDSTVLIVAQRISTILHADQIIVLDEGRIVGKGTHEELLKNCEVYEQIALSQLSKEELTHE